MERVSYINHFKIVKFEFLNHHAAGVLQDFERPCIGYILKGEAEFLYRGKTLHAKRGDLIYIARGTKYYSVWSGFPEIEFYSVDFRFANASDKSEYQFQILKNYPLNGLDQVFQRFCAAPMEGLGLFYLYLETLYLHLKKEDVPAGINDIQPAIDYLELNYTKKVYVKELARLCGLRESRFFVLFKTAAGCTPIDYKNNILIQHATELLSETRKTIEQISDELGFSSASYFRTLFKSVTGKNPKDVRK